MREEIHHILVDVAGVVLYVFSERHPVKRQWIEATGDIKDAVYRCTIGEDGAIELIKDGEPFPRRSMVAHDLPANLL